MLWRTGYDGEKCFHWIGTLRVRDGLGLDTTDDKLISWPLFPFYQYDTPDVVLAEWEIEGKGCCCPK